jgi:hypothetical protein
MMKKLTVSIEITTPGTDVLELFERSFLYCIYYDDGVVGIVFEPNLNDDYPGKLYEAQGPRVSDVLESIDKYVRRTFFADIMERMAVTYDKG